MNYVNEQNMQEILDGIARKIGTGGSSGALIGDTTPVGTIISFMGTQAPDFYLICDGTTYNIAEYQELADFIEAQFGAVNYFGGDGVDTFAVPDLRGEFLRGTGTNSHTNQGNGASVGVHQDGTELLDSTYSPSLKQFQIRSIGNTESYVTPYTNKDFSKVTHAYSDYTVSSVSGSSSYPSDLSGKFTSRPTNTSVLYCIKYNTSVLSTPENNYSTEEQRIGTWIDGKPLYQKTIVDTMPIVTTDKVQESKYIEVGVSVDTPVWYEIIRMASNNSIVIIPTPPDTDGYYTKAYFYSNSTPSVSNMVGLFSNALSFSGQTVYITIKYTKTTD